jgi:hypothetical protein
MRGARKPSVELPNYRMIAKDLSETNSSEILSFKTKEAATEREPQRSNQAPGDHPFRPSAILPSPSTGSQTSRRPV